MFTYEPDHLAGYFFSQNRISIVTRTGTASVLQAGLESPLAESGDGLLIEAVFGVQRLVISISPGVPSVRTTAVIITALDLGLQCLGCVLRLYLGNDLRQRDTRVVAVHDLPRTCGSRLANRPRAARPSPCLDRTGHDTHQHHRRPDETSS